MLCIINCGTSFLAELKESIGVLEQAYEIVGIEKLEGHDFAKYSGIVISGGPILLSEIDWKRYAKPFEFVKDGCIPVLGVCLGHQIIGLLHGSSISSGTKIDQKEKIEILEKDALFAGVENRSLFRESHKEFVSLPDGFTLLAKSASCGNEAMKHGQKDIYGVQFHPEKSGEVGRAIFRNFARMCKQ
jgi:GMP synthase (glutamine-hydrolysing)